MAITVPARFAASALVFVDPAATAFIGAASGPEQAFVGTADPIPDSAERRGEGRMRRARGDPGTRDGTE